MKNKKLKALEILNVLVKENFTLEKFSTDDKPIIINKTILKEAIAELKETLKENKNV